MMRCNILVFYDCFGIEMDSKSFKYCLYVYCAKHQEFQLGKLRITDKVTEFGDFISDSDVCFLDFGGLDLPGSSGMFDATERAIRRLIEDNPNILFIFMLTMPMEFYGDDELFGFSNVASVDAGDLGQAFEKYLAMYCEDVRT